MLDLHLVRKQGDFQVDVAFFTQEVGVTALFGQSGAGKTSVINMVAGLVRPDHGRIVVNGRTLFDAEKGIHLPPQKRRMGYIFQDGRLFPHLSVRANLTYGMRLTPPERRHVSFDDVVALLGIDHLLSRRPAKLSGGEKQRVAIGRALLTSPDLLLMDEPLASLDATRKAEVLPFLSRLCEEAAVPILYVSHSMEEVLNLADTLVLMDQGRVAACDAIENMMNRSELRGLMGTDGPGAAIAATVETHTEGLTGLRFAGGLLWVPRLHYPTGKEIRVTIAARDVAVATRRPEKTSFQNLFESRITAVEPGSKGLVDIHMDIGCPLTARVTSRAESALALAPGRTVWAMIKSVAVSSGHLNGHAVSFADDSRPPVSFPRR